MSTYKQSNIKDGKSPDKEAEEILWNKLCVDIISPYVIRRNLQRENLNLKSVTTIDPVIGWSKITQYYFKRVISSVNLVETTWLTRYPRKMKIMYDQGSESIGHEFRKFIIRT